VFSKATGFVFSEATGFVFSKATGCLVHKPGFRRVVVDSDVVFAITICRRIFADLHRRVFIL